MAGIGERPPTTTSSDAATESSGALLPGGGDYEEALEEDVVVEEEPFERELYAGGIPWDERAESTLGRSYGTDPNKFTIDPFRGPQMLPYDHPQNRRDNSYAPLYDELLRA